MRYLDLQPDGQDMQPDDQVLQADDQDLQPGYQENQSDMSPADPLAEHPPPFAQDPEEMVITQQEHHADDVPVIGHEQEKTWSEIPAVIYEEEIMSL